MDNLKPRFDKHTGINDAAAKAWIKAVELHPEAFDALLYLPVEHEVAPTSVYPTNEALELDPKQKQLDYGDPFVVSVVVQDEAGESGFATSQSGDQNTADSGGILLAKVAYPELPVGSMLEWNEQLSQTGQRRVWWYVQDAKGFGTTKAGVVYYLIPCRDLEKVNE